MSKVLVDRELLCHALRGGVKGEHARSELRGMLSRAQPTEVEGVEVVGYRVVAGSEMLFDVYEEALRYTDEDEPEQLMTVAQHLAALSAVTAENDGLRLQCGGMQMEIDELTAERDRLREANASRSDKLNEAQNIVDQLRAEVEVLRKDAERYRWLRGRLPGSAYRIAGVIYSEGGDGVDIAVDAAMAAKEE